MEVGTSYSSQPFHGDKQQPFSHPPSHPINPPSAIPSFAIDLTGADSSDQQSTAGKKPGTAGRKKKDTSAKTEAAQPKEKRTRKPRDPNKPPVSRKRQKVGEDEPAPTLSTIQPRPPVPTGAAGSTPEVSNPTAAPMSSTSRYPDMSTAPSSSQSTPSLQGKPFLGPAEQQQQQQQQQPPPLPPAPPHLQQHNVPVAQQQPQHARAISSGQRFDPIRAASSELAAERPMLLGRYPPQPPQPPPSASYHPRPSHTIASLLSPDSDPPYPTSPPKNRMTQYSASTSPAQISPAKGISTTSNPSERASLERTVEINNTAISALQSANVNRDSMDIDLKSRNSPAPGSSVPGTPPKGPSPKQVKQKKAAAIPMGSGLLSNATFGKPDEEPKKYEEVPNQCIVIEVAMNGDNGSGYVNFMKEVEQKYGFAVAHPRVAEHRKRMKEMASRSSALESGAASGDEMNIDLTDDESNAENGPGNVNGADEESAAPKNKRKGVKKGNEYDKADDFIDDSELLWEEQALASKDGYFVWSGPLMPEGSKPAVERSDGTIKRGRGRGRGGSTRGGESSGRGSRGGATSTSTRGRGTTNVRKPRVTKADRARVEAEKQEREREALSGSVSGTTVAKPEDVVE